MSAHCKFLPYLKFLLEQQRKFVLKSISQLLSPNSIQFLFKFGDKTFETDLTPLKISTEISLPSRWEAFTSFHKQVDNVSLTKPKEKLR